MMTYKVRLQDIGDVSLETGLTCVEMLQDMLEENSIDIQVALQANTHGDRPNNKLITEAVKPFWDEAITDLFNMLCEREKRAMYIFERREN